MIIIKTRLSAMAEQVVPHFNREDDHYMRVLPIHRNKLSNTFENLKL